MPSVTDLYTELEREVGAASPQDRLRLHPKVMQVMAAFRREGAEVPSRLRALDRRLADEAFDEMMDNLPV